MKKQTFIKALKILITDPVKFMCLVVKRIKILLNLDSHYRSYKKFMADGGESMRYDYPSLSEQSIVFDVGGYRGDFAQRIHDKYGCIVYIFEPHPDFYQICVNRFKSKSKIIPLNYGLGDKDEFFQLTDDEDGSSFLKSRNTTTIKCESRNFIKVMQSLNIQRIDLIKINIEGAEYQLLNHIIANNLQKKIQFYQIQFHNFFKKAPKTRTAITEKLKETHDQTYCYDWVWENWAQKEK